MAHSKMKATKAHAAAMKSYAKTITDPKRGRSLTTQPKVIVDPKRGRSLGGPKVIVTPRAKRGRSL